MPLPVPAEYPIVPPTLFSPNNPPFVPVTNCPSEFNYILPSLCSSVCNEATSKMHANTGRMLCYNLIVNNFYQNTVFQEVVQLVMDYILLQYKKEQIRSPDSAIQSSVELIMTMYTSNLICLYPDLHSTIPHQVLDAARQNAGAFNNLKQEIYHMWNNHPGQVIMPGHGMNHTPAPMYNGVPMAMAPQYQTVPMNHMAPMMGGYPSNNTNFGRYDVPVAPNNDLNSGLVTSRFGNSDGAVADSIRQDRYFARTAAANAPQQQSVKVVELEEKKQKVKYLEIMEGSEMDRSKHQITFLGDTYKADSLVRGEQMVKTTTELQSTNVVTDRENHFVHESCLLEPSIETAIVSGRAKQFQKQAQDSSINAFRCFCVVTTPLMSVEDIKEYYERILESNSFTDIVIKLKSLASGLSTKADTDRKYTDAVISFLKSIDNILTSMTNDFLKNKLSVQTQIGSFTDDISDLSNFLLSHYSSQHVNAFNMFEADVIDSITEKFEESVRNDMIGYYDVPEDLHLVLLPINYSITYVPMNDKELGYSLGTEAVIINKDTAPSLYAVAKSLLNHKKQMDLRTIHDLLVTADGVRYKLFQNYVNTDQYLIAKA